MPCPRPALLAVAVACGAVATAAALEPTSLSFPRFNRTYTDLPSEIAPVDAGGLTIELSSPHNHLELRAHRLDVAPTSDDTFRFVATVEASGEADLALSFGDGLPSLSDVVTLPLQEVVVRGRARVRRVDDGWEVVAVELPAGVVVELESELAGQLVATCTLLAAAMPGVECDGLARALSAVSLPLPDPGDTYLISASVFAVDEVERIDRALGLTP